MPHRLSGEQVEQFRRDGVLFPLPVFSAAEIHERRVRLEAMEADRAGRIPPHLNAKLHLLVPWLWDMVHDPRIVDAVEDLIGPDILCFGTSFIIKTGGDGRFVTWHQDATHWDLSAPQAVTAWVAFTPSEPANGCVRMLPGSNRTPVLHRDSRARLNMLGRREEVVAPLDLSRAVDVVLAPGEMSLHDPLIIHSSEANRSAARRVGFAIRYIPASLAQRSGRRNAATLVRGRDHGTFDPELPPEDLFHPAALRRHAESLRKGMAVIFGGDATAR